jgi:hypothetical protein
MHSHPQRISVKYSLFLPVNIPYIFYLTSLMYRNSIYKNLPVIREDDVFQLDLIFELILISIRETMVKWESVYICFYKVPARCFLDMC